MSCDRSISTNAILFHLRNQVSFTKVARSFSASFNNLTWRDINFFTDLEVWYCLIFSQVPMHYLKEAWLDEDFSLKLELFSSIWLEHDGTRVISGIWRNTSQIGSCDEPIDLPFSMSEHTLGSWSNRCNWRMISCINSFLRFVVPVHEKIRCKFSPNWVMLVLL